MEDFEREMKDDGNSGDGWHRGGMVAGLYNSNPNFLESKQAISVRLWKVEKNKYMY